MLNDGWIDGELTPPMRTLQFTDPQFELITSPHKFPAMVAGFGAGKSEALVVRCIMQLLRYLDLNQAYYMPTFDLIKKIAFPRFEEKLSEYGIPYRLNKSNAEIELEDYIGKVIFRTMDNPARIIGYEVADSNVDELDTLKTEDARDVWRKIIARNRQKKPDGAINTVAVGTTPEGFRFVYDHWYKKPVAGCHLIKATTYSNARNLPDDYIQTLLDTYPTALIAAYLNGEFVNLTSGSVYAQFDRKLNASFETIQGDEDLHIGMDFNVTKMAAAIAVRRKGEPHFVNELTSMFDTPAAIKTIKSKFPKNRIFIYPDASGDSRKSNNASVSDISLLRGAGFNVFVNHSNPAVKDRILAMNVAICSGEWKRRRLRVNVDKCPSLVESLEKQPFDKNGEPDKSQGLDHIVDAAGYFICYVYPVLKPQIRKVEVTGV